MKTEEKMALLKAVLSTAKADNDVDIREVSFFQQMCFMLGCDSQEIANAQKEVLGGKENFEGYLAEIKDRKAKLLLLYGMTWISFADNDFSGLEKDKIKEAAATLGVEEKKLQAIEEVVREASEIKKKAEAVLEINS